MRIALCLSIAMLLLGSGPAVAAELPAAVQAEERLDPALAAELETLLAEDDDQRKALMQATMATLRQGFSSIRKSIEEGRPDRQAFLERKQAVADKITKRLRAMVELHGWPGRSLVGDTGAEIALELVRRIDQDTPFRRWCLNHIEQAYASGDVPAGYTLASLTDEVLVAENKPQRYGTQVDLDIDSMTFQPKPIQDQAHVDERRKAMGLRTLEEELAARNAQIKAGARRAGPVVDQLKSLLKEYEQEEKQ